MLLSLIRGACLSACALLSFAYSAPSVAEDATRVLTLRDALTKSLERNPDLRAFGFEIEAQAGRIQQARARASPEVGLLVENAFGSGARSSLDAAETTLSIGFAIERGARERRIDVANAGSDLLGTDASIRRLDIAAETARRYIAVLEGQSQATQTENATRVGEQTLVAVQARVRAAKVPAAEEARAQAQLARMRLDEEHAEHELLSARRRLAALWGDIEADFGGAGGDLASRMEEAEKQSRYAYERGRYGYIEWAAAQRELLEAHRALLGASADVHRHRIEIERLTGGALAAAILP